MSCKRSVLPGADYRALKSAFRQLVAAVGGTEPAAAYTGYHHSRIAAMYHPDTEDMPNLAVVADLERVVGLPLVTAQLARLAGHALLPLPCATGSDAAALADVLRGAGELGARTALALADGRIADEERAGLVDGLGELARAVAHAQALLAGPQVLPLRRAAVAAE